MLVYQRVMNPIHKRHRVTIKVGVVQSPYHPTPVSDGATDQPDPGGL